MWNDQFEYEDLPPLEDKCIKCQGHGYQMLFDTRTKRKKKVDCEVCHRTGFIPSRFGEAVLRFLSFYKPWQEGDKCP